MTIRSVEHIGQGTPALELLLEAIGEELSERGESFVPSDVVSGFIRRTPALSEAERVELTTRALEAFSGSSRPGASSNTPRPAGGRISARPVLPRRSPSARSGATSGSASSPAKGGRTKFNFGKVLSNVTSAIQTGVGIAQQVAPLVAPAAALINAASAAGAAATPAPTAPSAPPATAGEPTPASAAPAPSPAPAAAPEPAPATPPALAAPAGTSSGPTGSTPAADADRATAADPSATSAPPTASPEPPPALVPVREVLPAAPTSPTTAARAFGRVGGAPPPAPLAAYDATALSSLLLSSPELQNALRLAALLGPAAPRVVALPAPASIAARPTTVTVPLSTVLQTVSMLLGRSMAELADEDAEESGDCREYLLTDAGEYVVDPGDPVQRAEWVLELFRESALGRPSAEADGDAQHGAETPLDFEHGPTTADGAEETNWETQ